MSSAWGWDGLEQGGYGRGRGRGGRGRSRGRGRGRGRTGALGGAEGRREVLERARAEREARAHERQRQRAATKIQGTVRRYQAERRVGMQWWEMLDTKLEGLARLRGRGGQSPLVPWPLLASLLRLFGQAVLLRARVGKLDCSGVATCANRLSALLAANMADTGPTSVTSVFQHRSPAALSQWTMVAASMHRACGVALLVEVDAGAEKAMALLLDCFHPKRVLLLPGVNDSPDACASAAAALEDASHNACAWHPSVLDAIRCCVVDSGRLQGDRRLAPHLLDVIGFAARIGTDSGSELCESAPPRDRSRRLLARIVRATLVQTGALRNIRQLSGLRSTLLRADAEDWAALLRAVEVDGASPASSADIGERAIVLGNLLSVLTCRSCRVMRQPPADMVRRLVPILRDLALQLPLHAFSGRAFGLMQGQWERRARARARRATGDSSSSDEEEESGDAGEAVDAHAAQLSAGVSGPPPRKRRPVLRVGKRAPPSALAAGADPFLLPELQEQLQLIVHRPFVTALFSAAFAADAGRSGGGEEVGMLGELFGSILVRWGRGGGLRGAARDDTAQQFTGPGGAVLDAVSLSSVGSDSADAGSPSSLVALLWRWLRRNADVDRLARDRVYVATHRRQAFVAILFFRAFSHLLLAVDDVQLHEHAFPLPRTEIQVVIRLLRGLLYRAMWVDAVPKFAAGGGDTVGAASGAAAGPGTSATGSAKPRAGGMEEEDDDRDVEAQLEVEVADAGRELFAKLHERHARRALTERDEDWQWPELPPRELEASVAQTGVGADRTMRVIHKMPHVLPFRRRAQLYTQLLEQDRERNIIMRGTQPIIRVRRTNLYGDAFDAFRELTVEDTTSLRTGFRVEFVNAEGQMEAGIDGGGLFKELLDTVCKEAFDPEHGFWMATKEGKLYPNPASGIAAGNHLTHFRFQGQLVGTAMYHGVLVAPRFADFFLGKLLGRTSLADDLASLDEQLYRQLMQLKAATEEELQTAGLTFTLGREAMGQYEDVELVEGGSDIPVTVSNVLRYVTLVANYKLNTETMPQCREFTGGMQSVLPRNLLGMFAPRELQLVIGGSEQAIDVDDWERHCTYAGYSPQRPAIQWFWQVVRESSAEQRAQLLQFSTACPRPPLMGFGALYPPFCIQRVPIDSDAERMPTAGTCMNLLKLPEYSSLEVMREKLRYAMASSSGFDLS